MSLLNRILDLDYLNTRHKIECYKYKKSVIGIPSTCLKGSYFMTNTVLLFVKLHIDKDLSL